MQDAKAEHPHLVSFLEERLPGLGLDDVETYGGYVLGTSWKTTTRNNGDDDDDEVEVEEEEEWREVLHLLQASSETHAEDDAAWEQLAHEIHEQCQLDETLRHQQEVLQKQQAQVKLQEQWNHAKQELQAAAAEAAAAAAAAQQQEEEEEVAKSKHKTASAVDEATKRALLDRFAFEQDEEDDDIAGTGAARGTDSAAPLWTNQQVAAQANAERAKELRSQKVQTKKEEQQKTKDQKVHKQQLKEERRKRTQKAERKR